MIGPGGYGDGRRGNKDHTMTIIHWKRFALVLIFLVAAGLVNSIIFQLIGLRGPISNLTALFSGGVYGWIAVKLTGGLVDYVP